MADSNEPQTGEEVCNFFRKPSNKNKNIRKRTLDTTDAEEDPSQNPSSSILHKLKKSPKPTTNLHFSSTTTTTSSKNRPSQSEPNPSAGDDDEDQPPSAAAAVFHFESSSQIQVHNDSRATATLETETEFNRDARAIRERVLKQADESLRGKGRADEKVYRGMNAYTDYKAGFRREQTVAGEKAGGAHGPLRASAHIRTSMRFDYQPDICKDYKETGYCGFGDSCKFMHDRGDYKSGWQMEREWDEAEKVRKRNLALGGGDDGDGVAERGGGGGGRDADDDDDEESLPFACFICRQPFQDPVVTKCKHYFCEHCALKHHSRNKKCYVCNKPTLGIFNTAHEIKKKMAEEK